MPAKLEPAPFSTTIAPDLLSYSQAFMLLESPSNKIHNLDTMDEESLNIERLSVLTSITRAWETQQELEARSSKEKKKALKKIISPILSIPLLSRLSKQIGVDARMEKAARHNDITQGIQGYQARYNQIIDALMRLSSSASPLVDPLERLPVEIGREIILHSVSHGLCYPIDKYSSVDPKRRQALMLVSKRWRQLVLDMPLLWSTILIDFVKPQCIHRIGTALHYSRDVPINLLVDVPVASWDGILPLLSQCKNRIKGISFLSWGLSYAANAPQNMIDLLEQLFPLPNLTLLDFGCIPSDALDANILSWISSHSKSLQKLQHLLGLRLTQEILQLSNLSQLRSLDTMMDLDAMMSIQAKIPSLTTVILYGGGPLQTQVPTLSTMVIEPSTQTNNEPLPLERLTCWQLESVQLPAFIPRLTNLVTLNLHANEKSLGPVLLHLHQLSQLRHMSLQTVDLPRDSSEPVPLVTQIQPNPGVISLNLRQQWFRYPNPVGVSSQYLLLLHDGIMKALPGVEKLDLYMPAWAVSLRFFDPKYWPKLMNSYLHITGNIFPKCKLGLGSSMRSVWLTSTHDVWSCFSSETTHKLHISSLLNAFSERAFRPTLDPQDWPMLQIMSIPSSSLFPPMHKDFVYLKELTLTQLWDDMEWFGEKTTRLCHRLASKPTILPALRSLTLHGTPQWDIYLIMLNRRNIVASENVGKFEKLGLYEDFPEVLAHPLVDLVKGKFPKSVALYKLSVHSALSTIMDSTK
jgi:hypothetical protein